MTDTHESRMWWDHLRRSGFIAGSGYAQPNNAFAGILGVQTGDGSGATPAAAAIGFTGLFTCSSNLPDKVAIALDVQMDDGNPLAGAVRGASGSGAVNVATTSAASAYLENGTNIYTLCRGF